MGRFEAALISHLNKRLASYKSAYGYNFSDDMNNTDILKNYISVNCPVQIRPFLKSIRNSFIRPPHKPFYLQNEYVRSILNTEDIYSPEYIKIKNIHDPLMISRAYTVDLVMADPF